MPEGLKWGFWDRVVEGRPIGAPANNGCCIKIKKKKTFVCLLLHSFPNLEKNWWAKLESGDADGTFPPCRGGCPPRPSLPWC